MKLGGGAPPSDAPGKAPRLAQEPRAALTPPPPSDLGLRVAYKRTLEF